MERRVEWSFTPVGWIQGNHNNNDKNKTVTRLRGEQGGCEFARFQFSLSPSFYYLSFSSFLHFFLSFFFCLYTQAHTRRHSEWWWYIGLWKFSHLRLSRNRIFVLQTRIFTLLSTLSKVWTKTKLTWRRFMDWNEKKNWWNEKKYIYIYTIAVGGFLCAGKWDAFMFFILFRASQLVHQIGLLGWSFEYCIWTGDF